ncbi:MAG: zinc ribbon domain-containing protein [Polyangiaceae bacterium]|nr:zinc ribbon domain-containing protein [Polyangiaceae bacterium]
MRYCPQCGGGNPDAASFCGTCGVAFPPAAPSPARPASGLGKHTMLGMAPLAPAPTAPPAPQAASGGGARTMLGMPPMSSADPQPPAGAAPTQLSFSAPVAPPAAPVGTPAAAAGPPAPAAPAPPRQGLKGTMIMGMPAVAPPAPAKRKANQTMLMAAPGKAPSKTLIGGILPRGRPREPEYVEEEYEEIVAETGQVERRVRLVERPLPPIYRRPAFLAIVGAAVLGAVGLVAVLVVRAPPPLVAEPRLDADGKDVLHVTCESCPDDTTITLAGAKGGVRAHAADVPLAAPLAVGDTELDLAIDRPGTGRDETVKVKVKVAFRIWPELAALQDPIPSVRVMLETAPGSSATVDGKPVTVGADGRGVAKVDVTELISGASHDTKPLAREIAYTIASPGREPAQGKLAVKVGISPLWLESPGARMVTDGATFMLAGRTAKGGGVTVSGRAISVSPEGQFAQLMNISAIGATDVKVRASVANLAPRIASITVQRVASLAAEARDREAKAKTGYDEVMQKGDAAVDTQIAWRGDVLSATAQGHQVLAVIGVSTGCAKKPCRARVTVPGGSPLATGDSLGVFGRVVGMAGADPRVPDVEADFVSKGAP